MRKIIMSMVLSLLICPRVFAQGDKSEPILPTDLVARQAVEAAMKPAAPEAKLEALDNGSNYKDMASQTSSYQVGIEDVLDINVIRPFTINNTMTVTSDGSITFPYIGTVKALGRTLSQIQTEIQDRLGNGYLDYPVVSVSLREARSKKYTIYGQVIRPGAYLVGANMTLLRSISLAGGLSVPGATGMVRVLHPNKNVKGESVFDSDITAILSGNKPDLAIHEGDTIDVTLNKFFVYGEVNRPGSYFVEQNMSLLNAITMAGGFIERGSTGIVKVLSPSGKSITLDIKDIVSGSDKDMTIQAGDTIDVMVDKFYIYGQIARPGAYPVRDNMDIMYAITAAGGFIQSGSMGRVKLFRANPQGSEDKVFESDIKSILSDGAQNDVVRAGDSIVVSLDKFFVTGQVNHPGAYPVEEHMSLLNAISTAGGLTASGGRIKLFKSKSGGGMTEEMETDFGSVLNATAPDVEIHAQDTIVVTANNFYVYGEVNRPGMYSLGSNTTALTAISIAGGFSKFGSASRVKVVRMNEKTNRYEVLKVNIPQAIAGNSKADVLLKPQDIVVVSEGIF